ncbi:hypothetical protein [Streptomyces lydicus]|uniref:hypothetical protein n=1 Tax=Streptomyces lydicus TaxID=47763 RepID=UPI0037D6AA2D
MSATPPPAAPPSASDYTEKASYHRDAMHERRSIGLRMFTAVVILDFVATKLVMDASGRASHPHQLTAVLRLVLVGMLLALAGLVAQLELRNRQDRIRYRTNALRAEAVLRGDPPGSVPEQAENRLYGVRQSWASTWPLVALLGLTAALWWFAALITHPAPMPARPACQPSASAPKQPSSAPPTTRPWETRDP